MVRFGDRLEIGSEIESHAPYLGHWIELLKESPKVLFQVPRMGKRRTASAGAASGKGRPQRSVNPVPPVSHCQWRAGLRSPCAAAHAEDSCATHPSAIEGTQEPGALLLLLLTPAKPITTDG